MSSLLTLDDIIEAREANPNGFLLIDWDNKRVSRNNNITYVDVYVITKEGKKNRLKFFYTKELIRAGIKNKEDRGDNGAYIQFRASSGKLGEVFEFLYPEMERQIINEINSKKNINVKGKKAATSTPIQKETATGDVLEDHIIRVKLPFKDGKAGFKMSKVVKQGDGLKEKNIYFTDDNVHEYLTNNTMTSGVIKMDCLMAHNFGISMPATLESIIIKPNSTNNTDIFTMMSANDLSEMITEEDTTEKDNEEEDEEKNDEEEDDEDEEEEEDTEAQLEALKKLAGN